MGGDTGERKWKRVTATLWARGCVYVYTFVNTFLYSSTRGSCDRFPGTFDLCPGSPTARFISATSPFIPPWRAALSETLVTHVCSLAKMEKLDLHRCCNINLPNVISSKGCFIFVQPNTKPLRACESFPRVTALISTAERRSPKPLHLQLPTSCVAEVQYCHYVAFKKERKKVIFGNMLQEWHETAEFIKSCTSVETQHSGTQISRVNRGFLVALKNEFHFSSCSGFQRVKSVRRFTISTY